MYLDAWITHGQGLTAPTELTNATINTVLTTIRTSNGLVQQEVFMGLFSSKKVISVASVPYNMAGDFIDRPNYLKSTGSRAVLVGNIKTLGHCRHQIPDRRSPDGSAAFYRWSKINYLEGMTRGRGILPRPRLIWPLWFRISRFLLGIIMSIDPDSSMHRLPAYIAERHILLTRPADYGTTWAADYIRFSNAVRIQYVGGSYEASLPALTMHRDMLLAYQTYVKPNSSSTIVAGSTSAPAATSPSIDGLHSW